jgi:hypothetical protein
MAGFAQLHFLNCTQQVKNQPTCIPLTVNQTCSRGLRSRYIDTSSPPPISNCQFIQKNQESKIHTGNPVFLLCASMQAAEVAGGYNMQWHIQ